MFWVQNSVFEGELTESQFKVVISGVKSIINQDYDSIIYYKFDSQNYTERKVIGVDHNTTDFFL